MKESESKKQQPEFPEIPPKQLREEQKIAKKHDLFCPEAGMPDYEAIEDVFGLSPSDIKGNPERKIVLRIHGNKHIRTDSESDENGDHIKYGADTEI